MNRESPGKGEPMSHNVLFFLTPKAMCQFLYDDYTVRQALEKMESSGYNALPILNRRGEYRGTLSEGDVLWAMKNLCEMDLRMAESRRIMEISHRKDNVPIRVTHSMRDLVERAVEQNLFLWWTTRIPLSDWLPERPSFPTVSTVFSRKNDTTYPSLELTAPAFPFALKRLQNYLKNVIMYYIMCMEEIYER